MPPGEFHIVPAFRLGGDVRFDPFELLRPLTRGGAAETLRVFRPLYPGLEAERPLARRAVYRWCFRLREPGFAPAPGSAANANGARRRSPDLADSAVSGFSLAAGGCAPQSACCLMRIFRGGCDPPYDLPRKLAFILEG